MNRIHSYIVLVSLLLAAIEPARAQRIKAETTLVDLGQVEYFLPASASFDFKNVGKRPLSVYKVDTGCGCTVAYYPTEPIAPGDDFSIKVTYDARIMGHFDKIIEVYTNAPDCPLQLFLRGQVVEEVEDYIGNFPFQLGELTADCNAIEFDDVYLGEVFQQRFHIYNPTGSSVQPQIMHLPSYLKAEVSPSTVKPNHSSEVTLTLDSRLMHGYGCEQTSIYLGANPGDRVSPGKQIDVSLTLLPARQNVSGALKAYSPAIQLSQEEVSLPAADGKKRSATIDIQNVGKTRLEIYDMQILGDGIQVSLSNTYLDPTEIAKLKITTEPKRLSGATSYPRLMMITNDPDRPKVVIEVNTGQ